jgi:hypothetical protein
MTTGYEDYFQEPFFLGTLGLAGRTRSEGWVGIETPGGCRQ